MESEDYIFTEEGHISEEGISVLLEHISENSMSELPDALLDHLRDCYRCRELMVESGLSAFPQLIHSQITPEQKAVVRSRRWPVWMKVAAGLVFLVITGTMVIWLISTHRMDAGTLFASYFQPYPDLISMKSSLHVPDMERELLFVGMHYYNLAQYDSAILVFDHLAIIDPDNDTLMFYRGIAHLAAGASTDTAVTIFSDLIKNNSPFVEQSQWYLALAWITLEFPVKARPLLENLQASSAFYTGKASSLLEKLEE